jgi:hypothetical protein
MKSKYLYDDKLKAVKYKDGVNRYQCSRAMLIKIAEANNAVIRIKGTRSVWLDTTILDKVFSAEGYNNETQN